MRILSLVCCLLMLAGCMEETTANGFFPNRINSDYFEQRGRMRSAQRDSDTSDSAPEGSARVNDADQQPDPHHEVHEISALHQRMLANSPYRSGFVDTSGQVDNRVPTPLISSPDRVTRLLNRPPESLESQVSLRSDGDVNLSASPIAQRPPWASTP
jgi:hypothetical protein